MEKQFRVALQAWAKLRKFEIARFNIAQVYFVLVKLRFRTLNIASACIGQKGLLLEQRAIKYS